MLSPHEENTMAKLTDTQLIVLSKAAARDDGIAVAPAKMNKAAAARVGKSIVARKLMREVRSKPGMPVWREDEDNRSISLMITRAGRDAIGVDESIVDSPRPSTSVQAPAEFASDQKRVRTGDGSKTPGDNNTTPRAGTKQALVIDMLNAKKGATLDALMKATGWLPHTTRAALTGLRKRGFQIERHRGDGEASSTYRIVADA
jgi:hypothetical protein